MTETAVTSETANWFSLPAEKWPRWGKFGTLIFGNFWRPNQFISRPLEHPNNIPINPGLLTPIPVVLKLARVSRALDLLVIELDGGK